MFQGLISNVKNILGQNEKFQINDYSVILDKLLSEGGYAYVYRVSDEKKPDQKYALKKMIIQDNLSLNAAKRECEVWKKLGVHPNIVRYITSNFVKNPDKTQSVLILNQLCEGGTLIDTLQKHNLVVPESTIIEIMRDVVSGVKFMHEKGIAHRDLKVENILYHEGKYKLCDFGSATNQVLDYNNSTKQEISKQMEQFEKYTTLMYRPPEMIDQYLKYKVDLQADLWMLGCILFTLAFAKQPFQEAQQLAIINAHYFIPNDEKYSHISEKMRDLIIILLTPNPQKRPNIQQLYQMLKNYDKITQIPLTDDAIEIKKKQNQGKNQKSGKTKSKKVEIQQQQQDNQNWGFSSPQSVEKLDNEAAHPEWASQWDSAQPQPASQTNNPFDTYFQFDGNEEQQQNDVPKSNSGILNSLLDLDFGKPSETPEDWFNNPQFQNDEEHKTEEHKDGWASFNFNEEHKEEQKLPPKDNLNDSDDEDCNEDADEEQPNMFQQINTLRGDSKQKQRGRGNRKRPIAKSWCSASGGQRDGRMRQNICTRTSDVISKLRGFLAKNE